MWKKFGLRCFLAFAFVCASAPTSRASRLLSSEWEGIDGPYCGIYSLAACLGGVGIQCDVNELWKTQYLGSHAGSNAEELMQAARDMGAEARCLKSLNYRDLMRATHPMILHCRSSAATAEFDHWIAFFGYSEGQAQIFDPAFGNGSLTNAELIANWDGCAIEIARSNGEWISIWPAYVDYAMYMVPIIGSVALLRLPKTQAIAANIEKDRERATWAITLWVLLGGAGLGLIWNWTSEVGLLRNNLAVADVAWRYQPVAETASITHEELIDLIKSPNTVLIDARLEHDFRRGTIPNSVSLPVSTSMARRKETLKQIGKNKELVVFCQSEGCGYADRVAQQLKLNGYDKIAIYRGGIREWRERDDPYEQR